MNDNYCYIERVNTYQKKANHFQSKLHMNIYPQSQHD